MNTGPRGQEQKRILGVQPATSTGPTGFELARLLASKQVSCQVVAPSLIPRAPVTRPETDRRNPIPGGCLRSWSSR
jgi:hypothetical protein